MYAAFLLQAHIVKKALDAADIIMFSRLSPHTCVCVGGGDSSVHMCMRI